MRSRCVVTVIAILIAVGAWMTPSPMDASVWIPTAEGTYTWSASANWTGNVPNAVDAVADFSTMDITGGQTIDLDTNSYTLGTLHFGDTASSFYGFTLTGNALTMNASSGTSAITVDANSVNYLNNSELTLTSGQTTNVSIAAGGSLTINGRIVASTASNATLYKDGEGDLYLTCANTGIDNSFTGLQVNNGLVVLNKSGTHMTNHAIGTIDAINAGGTVQLGGSGDYQIWGSDNGQGAGGNVALSGGTFDLYGCTQNQTVFTVSSAGGTLANSSSAAGTYNPYSGTLNGTLTVNASGDITLATGVNGTGIAGAGGMIKVGTGTLYLTGDNSYEGGTTINAGTLQIGNGGSAGTLGSGNVTNDSSLVFNRSDSAYSVGNAISGSGSVVNNGTGTITLSGANTYSGGTSINAGTLSVSDVNDTNGNIGTGSLTIDGGSTLYYTGSGTSSTGRTIYIGHSSGNTVNVSSGTLAFTGIVQRNGEASNVTLVKTGSGALVLGANGGAESDNSFLSLAANAGIVQLNKNSHPTCHAVGTITNIDATATVQLTGSGDKQIWAGDPDGGGNVYGPGGSVPLTGGTFDLNGHSQVQTVFSVSSAGGTLANSSTAAASSYTPYSTTLSGQLTVDASGDITLGGAASTGEGGITKIGAGKLYLSGANGYTGATAVNAGTLVINGSITGTGGDVTVASGATLAGNGSIVRNLIIQSGGNITPGNSVGNLTVGGNVDFSGTYQWELGSLVDNASGTAGTNWDLVTMSLGTLSGSAPTISIAGIDPTDDSFWKSSHVWNIVTGIGASTLSTTGGDITGYDTQYGYFDTTGAVGPTGGIMQLTWTPVPEPSSIVLLAAGLIGLIAYAWRKRK